MKKISGNRGPGIKMSVFGLILLTIPWLGFRYIQEMKAFLVAGQEQALLMAAKAVAMALHERDDLFQTHPGAPSSISERDLYAPPMQHKIRIDGETKDWGAAYPSRMRYFSRISGADSETPDNIHRMGVLLGQYKNHLNVLLEIQDNHVVYRDLHYRRLNNSDHIRLSFVGRDGREKLYIVTAVKPGTTSVFMTDDWIHASTGLDERRIRGYWRQTASGYTVEMRIPMILMDSRLKLGFASVDVDYPNRRIVTAIVGTYGKSESLNLVMLRSPKIEQIIRGFDRSGARIWIVDRDRRVRTEVGGFRQPEKTASEAGFPEQLLDLALRKIMGRQITPFVDHDPGINRRNDSIIRSALHGSEDVQLRPSTDSRAEIIMAATPIHTGSRVLGAVLIEQSTNDILSLQKRTLEKILGITLIVFLGLTTGLLLFAFRLTWRIHRLRSEAGLAIAPDGRVLKRAILADMRAEDAIGDLSRGISALLERLSGYTSFLERIPRTLRHEIINPLNALSTSLQNLEEEIPEVAKSKYMQSADRGIKRLDGIVQGLTDATNLESALKDEEWSRLDLVQLLGRYIENCSGHYRSFDFQLDTPAAPVVISGSGFRIEQLLDKLIDNAVDFSAPGGPVLVELRPDAAEARITVTNHGSPLPAGLKEQLFDSMVSGRTPGLSSETHLGIGLYVARVIAEHHSGHMEIYNSEDNRGVSARVFLPLYQA